MVLGSEAWRAHVSELHPYRWWIGFSIVVCGFATAVYSIRYG